MIDDIKKTLWAAVDKLRANMDAAEYKHLVLGLIFLKYISDRGPFMCGGGMFVPVAGDLLKTG